MTEYWQIGSGSGDRDYSEECIELGMAFVGDRYYDAIEEIEEGDIIVLRHGQKKIVAVGHAVKHPEEDRVTGCGDKEWLRDFVGWDLPAYCYVEWYRPQSPLENVEGLAQRAICRIHSEGPKNHAKSVLYPERPPDGQPGKKVSDPKEITLKNIALHLNRAGLDSEHTKNVVARLSRIRLLADHYYSFTFHHWDEVKEHEVRTFLIVPLLLALGWDEKRVKIELSPGSLDITGRESIDIAGFSQDYLPKEKRINTENCKVIIESKRFSSGVTTRAVEQVKGYAEKLPYCDLILVSNGYCYKAFVRDENRKFSNKPAAYLNLRAPALNYPFDPEVGGALKLLELLMPGSWK